MKTVLFLLACAIFAGLAYFFYADSYYMKAYVSDFADQNGITIRDATCTTNDNGRSRKGVCWFSSDQAALDDIIRTQQMESYGKDQGLDVQDFTLLQTELEGCLSKDWIKNPRFSLEEAVGNGSSYKILPWAENVQVYRPVDHKPKMHGLIMNYLYFNNETNQMCFDLEFPSG